VGGGAAGDGDAVAGADAAPAAVGTTTLAFESERTSLTAATAIAAMARTEAMARTTA
jgi:tetrahydromethanopterin S-methyltransferase subunit A